MFAIFYSQYIFIQVSGDIDLNI